MDLLIECSHSSATFFLLPNATLTTAVAAGATHSHPRLPLLHLSEAESLKPATSDHLVTHIDAHINRSSSFTTVFDIQ
jgi:hypothetical protein